ncbi:hypothetical protein JVU11DRAFT_662 [Chiua virens]|nr:hypothetical protein JVU11DRAFT_662 [Chiua virens]
MPDDEIDADWDEHTSWIALLHDDDVSPVDRTSLVERLGPAFAAHNRQGKEYIRNTFIPVVQHTKQLHDAIRNDVFPRRTQGLARFDDATCRFENTARRDMDATEAVYEETKRSLDALFSSLDDLVRQNDTTLETFKTTMREHVERRRRCVDQISADAERLIASLDKKAKHLGAEDHAKAKENLLRGILEKY